MSEQDQLTQQVLQAVQDYVLRPDNLATPESLLAEDLNLDSLDLIAVVMQLEVALNIKLGESDLEGLSSVNDLISACRRLASA